MKYVLFVAAALAVAGLLFIRPPQAPPTIVAPEATAAPAFGKPTGHPPAVVYVSGAVAHPGLYRLGDGARVDDAIRRAGGLRRDADADAINLAAHLRDGDHVIVAVAGAKTPRPVRSAHPRARRSPAPLGPIDINAATERDLALVPGIGPSLAGRIVALREMEGPFPNADALLDVAGMTPARLDRLRDYIRFYH